MYRNDSCLLYTVPNNQQQMLMYTHNTLSTNSFDNFAIKMANQMHVMTN